MKLLITGSNGLLGQKLVKLCKKEGIDFRATSSGKNRNSNCPEEKYSEMDICSTEQIDKVFHEYQPTAVIHTAAMTNVDACELNPIGCRRVNVDGTKNLWTAAQKSDIHVQLLSTDFVFDGENGPYSEIDPVGPLSVYAQSKVDAENILIRSGDSNWSISRTIIVYGTGENLSRSNIILWAREALHKGGPLSIVNDQFRSPTWADDLAWGCLEIVKRKEYGVFHLSGGTVYAIIDLVKAIAAYYNLPTDNIKEVSSSTLSQPAKRPAKTGFVLDKAKQKLDYNPKSLEETLKLLDDELRLGR
jgi:dTDP-4-dehydrorhamnose reductase